MVSGEHNAFLILATLKHLITHLLKMLLDFSMIKFRCHSARASDERG